MKLRVDQLVPNNIAAENRNTFTAHLSHTRSCEVRIMLYQI